MNRCAFLIAAAVMSLLDASSSFAAKATTAVTVIAYSCEQGPVTIAYAKKKSGEESVLAELAGKTVRMWRLTDRSEEMYVSPHGDGGSYRWRIGEEFGALTWLGPEADAKEKVLFDQCRPVSNR